MEENWRRADWSVELAGIADAWLWGFDIPGRWRLRCGQPAEGSLAVLPWRSRARKASLAEVVWIADCIAYDHDAPVGVSPMAFNRRAKFPSQPIIPMGGDHPTLWYFKEQLIAFAMVAEMRFGESYLLRYDPDDSRSPGTDFDSRFAGREWLVSLYAMGTRQADLLSEYLCLYRVLEAADGRNGLDFIGRHLGEIRDRDFGYPGAAWERRLDQRVRRVSAARREGTCPATGVRVGVRVQRGEPPLRHSQLPRTRQAGHPDQRLRARG